MKYLESLAEKVKDLSLKIKRQQELLKVKKKDIEDFKKLKTKEEREKKDEIVQLQ